MLASSGHSNPGGFIFVLVVKKNTLEIFWIYVYEYALNMMVNTNERTMCGIQEQNHTAWLYYAI